MGSQCNHVGLCWCLLPEWNDTREKLAALYPDHRIWFSMVLDGGSNWVFPSSITWHSAEIVIGGAFADVIERNHLDADSPAELERLIAEGHANAGARGAV